jgi:hypothetical protein
MVSSIGVAVGTGVLVGVAPTALPVATPAGLDGINGCSTIPLSHKQKKPAVRMRSTQDISLSLMLWTSLWFKDMETFVAYEQRSSVPQPITFHPSGVGVSTVR